MRRFSLERIYNRFCLETFRLAERFATSLPSHPKYEQSCAAIHQLGREACVIRLWDAWSRFCREVVIRSACAAPVTASGLVLPHAPGIKKRSEVIPTLLKRYKKRRFEPRWGDPGECINAAKLLNVSNYATVLSALSVVSAATKYVRFVRNYIAHRNKYTAADLAKVVLSLGLPPESEVDSIVRHIQPGGLTVFEEWIIELRTIARLSIQ